MKKILNLLVALFILSMVTTSCLYSGMEKLENSSNKDLTAVNYTYRFAYDDTIKKGTPNVEIQKGRICEVIFKKQTVKVTSGAMTEFQTTLTYDINSVQKAGPTGSVTKQQLYAEFDKQIKKSGLTRIWVSVTISDVATVIPMNGAPKLGAPGDFSKDCVYRVKAANGSTQDYSIKTYKGFVTL